MSRIDWSDISLFSGLAQAEIEKLQRVFSRLQKRVGENLVVEGDSGDEMYILVSGKVRIFKSMLIKNMTLPLAEMANPRKVLATLDESSYPTFGEMALLDRDTRSATVEAVADSEFLVIDREQFFDFIDKEPEIGCKLLVSLGRRMAAMVRRTNVDMVKLTTALALALGKSSGAR